jgi:hypothetical protein
MFGLTPSSPTKKIAWPKPMHDQNSGKYGLFGLQPKDLQKKWQDG